jgi:hypothetical protein
MAISDLHLAALRYVRNAGGAPEVAWFDEDHEPIGPSLRADLIAAGLIKLARDEWLGDVIVLTVAGERLILGHEPVA